MFKQFARVDALILWVAVGKEFADVAKSQCTKQCIANGMYRYVAVGVCYAAFGVLDLHATEYKTKSLCKGVNVETVSYSNVHNLCCFIAVTI